VRPPAHGEQVGRRLLDPVEQGHQDIHDRRLGDELIVHQTAFVQIPDGE
jgi:hypothetical protein